MALYHYLWSRTAASNANADPAVNMAEGMAPSAVNDGVRALMASAAGFRDDIAGAIVTTGTSTAYAVTSYQVFNTLANMANQVIAFTPHVTNGATVTLNVDGLGAKPLRPAPSVELQSNVLILGTPYVALYNNSDAVWYLQGMGSNAYGIPLAGGMDFWGTTAPSSAFAFPAGQALSRTTYATLFSIMSTTYGVGDGSTTFNLPDKTGRVSAMKEASATRLTNAVSGVTGSTMGSAGGAESQTLTQAQLPNISLTSNAKDVTVYASSTPNVRGSGAGNLLIDLQPTGGGGIISQAYPVGGQVIPLGSGTAHPIVQPTIVCNYIIRVI